MVCLCLADPPPPHTHTVRLLFSTREDRSKIYVILNLHSVPGSVLTAIASSDSGFVGCEQKKEKPGAHETSSFRESVLRHCHLPEASMSPQEEICSA